MQFAHSLSRRLVYIFAGVLDTLLMVLLVLNLIPQVKQLDWPVQDLLGVVPQQHRHSGPRVAWNPESTRVHGVSGKKVDPGLSLRAVRNDKPRDIEE